MRLSVKLEGVRKGAAHIEVRVAGVHEQVLTRRFVELVGGVQRNLRHLRIQRRVVQVRQRAQRRHKRGLDGQFGADLVAVGGVGQVLLVLALLVVEQLEVEHAHKAILVFQDVFAHLRVRVT